MLDPEQETRRAVAQVAAEDALEDLLGERAERYRDGVWRAIGHVPDWVWESEWEVEVPMELKVSVPSIVPDNTKSGIKLGVDFTPHTVTMRPDMYRVTDSFVDLVEVKTTKNDPLSYLLWNPQHEFYALKLQEMYPDKLVRFRYLCLPTQGKPPAEPEPWVFGPAQQSAALHLLGQYLSDMTQRDAWTPNRGRHCDFCDYKDLCIAVHTGAEWEGVAERGFAHD